MKRGISRAIHSTRAELSHSIKVLVFEVFSKGNAMVILTSSRKRQHVLVEASETTVVAEIINTF